MRPQAEKPTEPCAVGLWGLLPAGSQLETDPKGGCRCRQMARGGNIDKMHVVRPLAHALVCGPVGALALGTAQGARQTTAVIKSLTASS